MQMQFGNLIARFFWGGELFLILNWEINPDWVCEKSIDQNDRKECRQYLQLPLDSIERMKRWKEGSQSKFYWTEVR